MGRIPNGGRSFQRKSKIDFWQRIVIGKPHAAHIKAALRCSDLRMMRMRLSGSLLGYSLLFSFSPASTTSSSASVVPLPLKTNGGK